MSGVFGPDDRHRLLKVARASLEARVRRLARPPVDRRSPLDERRGAFVSIHRGWDLRGCLGRIEGDRPVGDVVAHLAEAVSDSDPRFAPVLADELAQLRIEISLLTPEREGHADEIEVGRHGLIVEHKGRRGLLLPQVAVEHRWDAQTFVRYTCLKAGLPPEAWPREARLYLFEAQVFGESASQAEA